MADGQIVFEITADGKHAIASVQDVTKAIQQESGKWEDTTKKSTGGMSSSFTSTVKAIATTIGAAKIGQKLLDIGKDAIQAASDLEEVQNVVDVTFGEEGSAKIDRWASNAGKQFGLTETQAKKFTSTLGAMMKSAGVTGNEIVNMSTDLAGLAADMASFYNLDFETAFQKIRSGISGETEPLKQLGINMSVANLNAYALAQGLEKTFDEMDQGEQTMLRYQYIMQATADAQGDFARTSDGFANATRKMETNIESLKTKLGEILLPVVNDVISGINSMIEALMPKEKEKTILDEFAEIDLKTQEKIAGIQSTAGQARDLVSVLDDINTKAGNNKTAIKEMADEKPNAANLDELVGKLEGIETQSTADKTAVGGIDDESPDGSTLNSLVGKLEDVETKATGGNSAITNIAKTAPSGNELKGLTDKLEEVEKDANNGNSAITNIAKTAPSGSELNSLTEKLEKVSTDANSGNDAIMNIAKQAPDGTELKPLTDKLEEVEKDANAGSAAIMNISKTAPTGKTGNLKELKESVEKIGSAASNAEMNISKIANGAPTGENLEPLKAEITNISTVAGTAETAVDGIMTEIPAHETKPFTDIVGDITGVKESAGEASKAIGEIAPAIEEIAQPTEEMAETDALWLATCEELVKTLPGLSSIINTQTGEIKGGTQAVKDYIDEWEKGQTKLALYGALGEKESALSSQYADLPKLELEMALARKRYNDALKKANEKYGEGMLDATGNYIGGAENLPSGEEYKALLDTESDILFKYWDVENTTKAYNDQVAALKEAEAALQEYRDAIEEQYGTVEDATGATEEWSEAQKAAASEAVNAFGEALAAVEEYYDKIRKETEAQVNNSLSGFESIKSVTDQYIEALQKTEEGKKELEDLKKMFGEGFKLEINATQANKTLTDMISGLRSQIDFINQYQQDLATAREKGLNEQLLSFLSDGSEQSATYLNAIAHADDQTIEELNKTWAEAEQNKQTFVDTLTQQKLEADTQYKELVANTQTAYGDMVKAAEDAAKDLDVSKQVTKSTTANITALANAIKNKVPDVTAAVDKVLAQLKRLNEWGVDLKLGNGGGTVGIHPGNDSPNFIPGLAVGADWIPFDGFLARLHEGEAVLTAEENRVWQAFKNGQRGVDYDQLGGVMRDNIRPGGNVYLDGRLVGGVISDIQGDQYRSLKRSGWQR